MRYFVLLLFISIGLNAQEYQSQLVKSGIKLDSGDIPNKLILKVNQDENGFTRVIIQSESKEEAKFLVKPFGYDLFKAKLIYNGFGALNSGGVITGNYDETNPDNEDKIVKLYSDISSYFYTVNERPQVADISLKDEVKVYMHTNFVKKTKRDKTKPLDDENTKTKRSRYNINVGVLSDAVVDISFYSGFIEKIEVRGKVNGKDVKFANKYSIGVSSLSNIKNFDRIRLFSLYDYKIDSKSEILEASEASEDENIYYQKIKGEDYALKLDYKGNEDYIPNDYKLADYNEGSIFIYLNEVIDYQRIIDVNANDISPDKQKIRIDKRQKSAKLYREESTKIVEAVVYSDLLGALEEENPNGIIQTEVSKKFNINTARGNLLGSGGGVFEYLDARVLLSKIEEDNKFLLPTNNEFALLDLYRHRTFSVGGLLNIISYENQDLKMNFFYESGVEFSRNGYKLNEDSEGQNINAIEWAHQFKFHIFPEKRYGIIFRDRLFYYEIIDRNEEFRNILNMKKDWLNTMELSAYLDISTSSKVFVRYALVHELSNLNNNFSRFQIGTTFFFLQKNRKDK